MGNEKRRNGAAALMCALLFIGVAMVNIPAGAEPWNTGGPEPGIPAHYPIRFDGIGVIDRIAPPEIVINDSFKQLSSSVTYATPSRKEAASSFFRVGHRVGFVNNAKGEIKGLYLLK